MAFEEIGKAEVSKNYPAYFHEDARYFKVINNHKTLCLYGVISRTGKTGEAFLMLQSFQGKVLSRDFFIALFNHTFSLGYKEIYTWTKWDRLIKLFGHFKKFGIEETNCPPWGKPSKVDSLSKVAPLSKAAPQAKVNPDQTWFIKRM